MSEHEIREAIRDVYTALAEYSEPSQAQGEGACTSCGDGCSSCGGCTEGAAGGSFGGFDPVEATLQLGYSEEDFSSVPGEAVLGLGCGNPVAAAGLGSGEAVLDLGSGSGLDCLIASLKVGISGRVVGVDANESMIKRAREAAELGFFRNVEFRLGEMESLPVDSGSMDAVISNCSINLSLDKPRVFREAHRVLKPGGRITVSDMVTLGELPEDVRVSPEAWANCVAGAEEKDAYLRVIREAGFTDVKVVADDAYGSDRPDLDGKLHSITVQAVKP